MATVNPTNTKPSKGILKSEWVLTATADIGAPINAPTYPDKTVEWGGTMSNAVVGMFGSNNTATGPYTELTSATGGTTFRNTAGTAKIAVPLQNPLFLRPQFVTATANANRLFRVTIISQSPRR